MNFYVGFALGWVLAVALCWIRYRLTTESCTIHWTEGNGEEKRFDFRIPSNRTLISYIKSRSDYRSE